MIKKSHIINNLTKLFTSLCCLKILNFSVFWTKPQGVSIKKGVGCSPIRKRTIQSKFRHLLLKIELELYHQLKTSIRAANPLESLGRREDRLVEDPMARGQRTNLERKSS